MKALQLSFIFLSCDWNFSTKYHVINKTVQYFILIIYIIFIIIKAMTPTEVFVNNMFIEKIIIKNISINELSPK